MIKYYEDGGVKAIDFEIMNDQLAPILLKK